MQPDASDFGMPAAGPSVASLIPALLGARDDEWLPAPARSAEQVVLLVLDGLGWSAVETHPDIVPTLAGMAGGPIPTVVPSTTATALTSITTGLAPAEHGVVGYRMRVDDEVLNVLRWSVAGGRRAPDPLDVQRHATFLGRAVPVVTRAEFRTTGFTQAHLRGARFVGWHTLAGLIEQSVRAVEAGERLVYAYYPGVDTIAHEFGLRDRVYRRELADTDRFVGELIDALPARAALLVTSDHGQVHLEPESWVELPEVAQRSAAMAGDGRFRYCYAPPGGAKELLAAARDTIGDRGRAVSRREVLELGWLGTGPSGSIPGRIGDVVLVAHDACAFVDPSMPHEPTLRSGHGGLSRDEIMVPLLAATGRAAGTA